MKWLSTLFKDITLSKTLTGAFFLTSASILYIPRILPKEFDIVPKLWMTIVLSVFVFSGVLLFFWFISFLYQLMKKELKSILQNRNAKNLTKLEYFLMVLLAELADGSLDIRTLNYNEIGHTKLAVLNACQMLNQKGLIKINSFHENIIYLTDYGRKNALVIQSARDT